MSKSVTPTALAQVSSAIQKQVSRDFGPLWDVDATIDDFAELKDVPIGYWPVLLVDDDDRLPDSAAGVHLDNNGQPFSLVKVTPGWGMTTSHEVLEMLADPFGNRLIAGDSPAEGQGRVDFLLEVCDPSEATDFGYTVNGFMMSDFYTPHYFDPVASGGVRYSFTGAITEPRQVLKGGYLSWHDPTSNEWFQLVFPESGPEIRSLGKLEMNGSLRATIERISNVGSLKMTFKNMEPVTAAVRSFERDVEGSCAARAKELMKQVEDLANGAGAAGAEKRGPKRLKIKPKKPRS